VRRAPATSATKCFTVAAGAAFKLETAGTFKTMKAARSRRDVVAGWLAQGLNPQLELAKVAAPMPERLSLKTWCERYKVSRVDYADETTKNVRSHIRRSPPRVNSRGSLHRGDHVRDVAELVAEWREVLKPSSIKRYVATLRLVFDYAGVDPNPARDDRVKLPTVITQEVNPPTADHFVAMLEAMPRRYWLPLVVLEQTGMRVGEAARSRGVTSTRTDHGSGCAADREDTPAALGARAWVADGCDRRHGAARGPGGRPEGVRGVHGGRREERDGPCLPCEGDPAVLAARFTPSPRDDLASRPSDLVAGADGPRRLGELTGSRSTRTATSTGLMRCRRRALNVCWWWVRDRASFAVTGPRPQGTGDSRVD
jgi:hypothetical protein